MATVAADLRELREDYAAGRLTLDEFAERVGSALREPDLAARPDSFDAHLVHGEKVLWVGRPDPAKRISRSDRVLIPSLVWGGLALVGAGSTVLSAGGFDKLVAIPFAVLGLYFLVGRF